MPLTLTLVLAAIAIGSVHTLAPDHWLPFAALARAERWSTRRTAVVTAGCGLGHVTVSVALGLLAAWLGLELFERVGHRLESASGLLLIGVGVAYGAWGLHHSIANRTHAHAHGHVHAHTHLHPHRDDIDGHRPLTAWTLFLLFSADPCVAVVPLMFAVTPLGPASTIAVTAAYEIATITTMVVLVLPACAAARVVRGAWVDRWGEALAGGIVALVGIAVVSLGI